MPPAALRWLVVLALLSCAVAAAQDDASDAIRQCLAQVEDPGPEDAKSGAKAEADWLEDRCPGLKDALRNSPAAAWLPEGMWSTPVSKQGIADLHDQLAWESALHEARTIDTAGVEAALASLGDAAKARASGWWQRLRDWLRSRLQRDPQAPPGWLFKWLENLASYQTALRITVYVLCGLIVLAAGWIVFRELEAAGTFGSRSARLAATGGAPQSRSGRALRLGDLEGADPAERPSMLVALIVAALARQADRAEDTTSTHRELARRIELGSQLQRTAFEVLLACAERLRYAAARPSRDDIDQAIRSGVALLRSLLPGDSRP